MSDVAESIAAWTGAHPANVYSNRVDQVSDRDLAQGLSNIEPHERDVVKSLIDDHFIEMTGHPFDLKPAGYMLALKIYVRPEELKVVKRADGTEQAIYLPDVVRAEDKYSSCVALVCGLGPDAYRDEKKFNGQRWCDVGDWIVVPRYEMTAISFRGVAMGMLPDDRVMAVITGPEDVSGAKDADRY